MNVLLIDTYRNRGEYCYFVFRELRALGFSLNQIATGFTWHGPHAGVDILAKLFKVDVQDVAALAAGQPLWRARYERLATLNNMETLSSHEMVMRDVLQYFVGHDIADDERGRVCRELLATGQPLPLELDLTRLIADYCNEAMCRHDTLLGTDEGHEYMLRSFVNRRCLRVLGLEIVPSQHLTPLSHRTSQPSSTSLSAGY